MLAVPSLPQKPLAPSMQQAGQAEAKSQREMPPPLEQRTEVDTKKLKGEAQELASLAATIPTAVDQATKGVLAKDLPEKLKRIEKLSKQIRSQITR